MRFQGFELILTEVNVYLLSTYTAFPKNNFHKETLGAFHSTKTSSCGNFRRFPVANRTAFFKNSKKEDNLARYTQLFSRKFSFHSFFLRGFLGRVFVLNGSHFGNSTVSGISGNFSWKFLYHLLLFSNFRKV